VSNFALERVRRRGEEGEIWTNFLIIEISCTIGGTGWAANSSAEYAGSVCLQEYLNMSV